MVKTTLEKILNHFNREKYKYKIRRVDRKAVEKALENSNYIVHNNIHKLSAYKRDGNNRFHIEIDIFPDNEIHKESELRMHKDVGHGLFHDTEFGKEEVSLEFLNFTKELIRELKRKS